MTVKEPPPKSGYAQVRLISEQIIECILVGNITGKIVEGSMLETKKLAEQVRATGKKPRLLIDMHKLTHQDSEARSRSKAMITYGMEKIAIFGAGRMLKTIGQYIVRIAGLRRYTRFFRTRTGAIHWLETEAMKTPSQKPVIMALCALLVTAIAVATLTGWARSNEILVSIIPGLPAMNPVTAVCLVLLALAILLLGRKQTRTLRLTIYVIAGLTAIFGLTIGLRHFFGVDIPVDRLLFNNKLDELGGRASSGASLLFISTSILLVLATVSLKNTWKRRAFQLTTLFSVLVIAIILINYIFGMVDLYDITRVSLPINTALAFLIVTASIVGATYKKGMFPLGTWLARNYGRGILVAGGMLLLTGLLWQQANINISRNLDSQAQQIFDEADNTIQTRVNAYVDALHGYKAFFESSSNVDEDEFERYFTHSELQKHYPGFSSISFVRAVKSSDGSEQYPLAYIEPSNTSTVTQGTNIGLLPERRALFEAARDSGTPRTSEPVSFASLDGQGSEDGFIISIPVYKDGSEPANTSERRENIYGFVNAVFRNKVLFNEIFEPLRNSEAGFRLYDVDRNETIMYQTSASLDFSEPRVTRTIEIPGEQWQLEMQTAKNFGTSNVTSSIPRIMLSSGIVVALLSGFLVVSLSRRREEALTLAASMTEDLNNEREQAETSRKKDDAILASIGDAVFAIDKRERITLFNPAAVKLTGFSEQEAIGKQYSDILTFVGGDNKPSYSFIQRALGGHITSMKNDMRLIQKDGSIIEVADSAAPIYDFGGKLQGVIVVFRDVTSERALDQAKSEFVSLASHQLRTPLSAINWYSEMLLNQEAGKLNKDQHEYIKEIFEGNQRMIELVDSLLNVSRLEVGKLRNEPQDVSLVELADSLERELHTSIEAKKITLTRDLAPKLPTVSADPKLLRMVMQNLLSNAVKYTPNKGHVKLDIHPATEKELRRAGLRSGKYFFLSVSDNGYGIPKEQQGKIFEKLFRADNVRKMDVEGTGLGLYIVQEVARKLGGAIWFESTESVGTTFYVVIPLKTKPS